MSQPCPSCRGSGKIVTRVCKSCRGKGSGVAAETIKVKIPPGAETGSRIKLRGHGRRRRTGWSAR